MSRARDYGLLVRPSSKRYLDQVAAAMAPTLSHYPIKIAVITDTHDKFRPAMTYYGPTGLMHVSEQSYLAQLVGADLRVHLGDAIDGSERPMLGRMRLALMSGTLATGPGEFMLAKGNHDDNDKFAEARGGRGAFMPAEYDALVQPALALQEGIHTAAGGVQYRDYDRLRVIILNTSDNAVHRHRGRKVPDEKRQLAVREPQLRALAKILAGAGPRDILLLGHAPALRPGGRVGLTHGAEAVQGLLEAFRARHKGRLVLPEPADSDYAGSVDYDFTQVRGRFSAYLAGHWHTEAQYQVRGVNYTLLNCSALMGPYHLITTDYNRAWHRRLGTSTESAGYILGLDPRRHRLAILGYGATSRVRIINY
ncbi:metallophosphoesterase family protein [Lacticaseibacillus zhaodongensis]|uniref:metallophosphoesterase family protein n=1 Tax=Lacticaseibacillus zhaodongensis TaxID=2668065 RepID=UPI0012D2E7C1|nr:metallophosphoesterase [Lacticaseibacillus zhaodongensis]